MHDDEQTRRRASPGRRRALKGADDDTLLAWTRAGNQHAFVELYRRHRADLLCHARRVSLRYLHTDAADDLLSEAVTKTLTAFRRGNGPQTSFRRYMFASVRNIAFTRSTGNRIEPTDQPPDSIVDAPDQCVDALVAAEAFGSLPARWQQVLWATKVLGYAPSELAEQLGLGANTVSVLSNRALDGLRIAYTRAQLPPGRSRDCSGTLDAMARGSVIPLSRRHTHLIRNHLADCGSCRDVADGLATEHERRRLAMLADGRRGPGWQPAAVAS